MSIGQILKIPTIETVALYIVKKGDSLYSIAKSYDTTVDELIKLNNLKSNSLSVGQQLKLPINGNVSDGEYVVVAGDSLYSIAKKFNISVDELVNDNETVEQNTIIEDKKIGNASSKEKIVKYIIIGVICIAIIYLVIVVFVGRFVGRFVGQKISTISNIIESTPDIVDEGTNWVSTTLDKSK